MNRKQCNMLTRIIIALVMTVGLLFINVTGWLKLALYLAVYLIIGYDILKKAWLGIIHGRVFDENFLMTVATVGAFALALYEKSGDYLEAIAVMLFYQIGEFFQSYAVGKSRRNIAALMDIRPDYANIEEDGKIVKVNPDDVEVGQTIIVRPGERIPIDGVIVSGESSLNTSALTGESLPREVCKGDEVISGSINLSGLLKSGQQKSSATQRCQRFWSWWRIQLRESQNRRISLRSLQEFTLRQYVTALWLSPCCHRFSLLFSMVLR